jgi:predicted nucleotide-binding protein (sugar kinase/HSP70/actin superfamily)
MLPVKLKNEVICISRWITDYFIRKMLPVKLKNEAHEAGMEYIRTDDIGGHGIHTVGWSVLSAKNGLDGVIHLYPFTCMPEIVAQCTFSEVQDIYGIPIMTLILDELTGEAGFNTRLEAFVDMLKLRREAIAKSKPAAKPGALDKASAAD